MITPPKHTVNRKKKAIQARYIRTRRAEGRVGVRALPLLVGNIRRGPGGMEVINFDSPLNDSRQLECTGLLGGGGVSPDPIVVKDY